MYCISLLGLFATTCSACHACCWRELPRWPTRRCSRQAASTCLPPLAWPPIPTLGLMLAPRPPMAAGTGTAGPVACGFSPGAMPTLNLVGLWPLERLAIYFWNVGLQDSQLDLNKDWTTGGLGKILRKVETLLTTRNPSVLMLQEPRPCRAVTGGRGAANAEIVFQAASVAVLGSGPEPGEPAADPGVEGEVFKGRFAGRSWVDLPCLLRSAEPLDLALPLPCARAHAPSALKRRNVGNTRPHSTRNR